MTAIQPPWADGPGVPGSAALYVNSAGIAFSQWDLTLDFQLATPPERLVPGVEAQVTTQRVARLVMSLTHAKVLARDLQAAVAQWETQFGALPTIEALMQRPAAASNESGTQDGGAPHDASGEREA